MAEAIRAQYTPSLADLIPAETIQILERITQYVPQQITSLWGYELPLYKSEKLSDFLVCLHQPNKLWQAFESDTSLRQIIAEPLYGRLRTLAHRWTDDIDKVGQLISNMWLEYDYETLPTDPLRPNFFFGPKSDRHFLEVVWASRQIFELLSSEGLPEGTYRFLVTCISQLGDEGWVAQIGRMLARRENSLRLFIQQLPPNGIVPYLTRLAYPHIDNPTLREQLERCYELADTVDLDIDITNQIGDQLGFECYFNTTEKALLFLDHLAQRGLCVSEKYQPLRTHLLQIRLLPDQKLLHGFSHIKLGFHPARGFVSKVYLGYVERDIASYVVRTKPLSDL